MTGLECAVTIMIGAAAINACIATIRYGMRKHEREHRALVAQLNKDMEPKPGEEE